MPFINVLATPKLDWPLILRLRLAGFAAGLATSSAFLLALSSALDPTQRICLGHFTYPLGEVVALFCAALLVKDRTTFKLHAVVTVAWVVAVAWTCQLWVAFAAGALPSVHAATVAPGTRVILSAGI
jgi:hypothetical protein